MGKALIRCEEKDGSSFGGEGTHELADPLHTLGVEPVDRSSRMSVLGSPRWAAAMPSLPMPRQNPPTRFVATPARPVISMTSLTPRP
jgi:hypothetical protein